MAMGVKQLHADHRSGRTLKNQCPPVCPRYNVLLHSPPIVQQPELFMKHDELTGLLQEFSPKVFQNTLKSLRAAYQADTANPVRNVFQALEAALSAPGVTQLDPVEIPAGQTSVNGRVMPASAGSWLVRIAEISGGGAPYLKVEQIRTNAFVVPLRLNTARPVKIKMMAKIFCKITLGVIFSLIICGK